MLSSSVGSHARQHLLTIRDFTTGSQTSFTEPDTKLNTHRTVEC
jgi:hypothetical protein